MSRSASRSTSDPNSKISISMIRGPLGAARSRPADRSISSSACIKSRAVKSVSTSTTEFKNHPCSTNSTGSVSYNEDFFTTRTPCPDNSAIARAIFSARSPRFDPSDRKISFIKARTFQPEAERFHRREAEFAAKGTFRAVSTLREEDLALTKQPRLPARFIQSKMFVSQRRGHAAALRAVQQAQLHQVRLVDFLDRILLFAQRSGDRAQTHRAPCIFLNNSEQQIAVHFVQPMIVHTQHRQRIAGYANINVSLRAYFSKIPHTPQQSIRHARRPPAAARNFRRSRLVHSYSRNHRRTMRDEQQVFWRIKFQPVHNSKPRTQRRHDQSGARRRANQRELIQLIGMHARPGPLPDNQIHAKILHRGIQNFLQRRLQAMNLIQKEKILRLERCKDRRQVAFLLQQRPRTHFDRRTHLVRQNLRQGRLSQARRPVQ